MKYYFDWYAQDWSLTGLEVIHPVTRAPSDRPKLYMGTIP